MTPEKCPNCGAKLRPDMLACPNCPMSFPEDEGSRGSSNPLKQSRYYQFLLPLLFFGAIGATVWYLGAGLMHLGLENNEIETGNVFGEKAGAAAPAKGPGADGRSRPARTASDDDEGVVVVTRAAPDRKAPAGRPTVPTVPGEWRLRGAVFDLTTFLTLPGCEILFTDEATNRSIRTRTDSSGRYRALVPPLSGGRGYGVAVEKDGYARNYLDPRTRDVRGLGAEPRARLARDLSTTLLASPAVVRVSDERPLVTDFYLAPRR